MGGLANAEVIRREGGRSMLTGGKGGGGGGVKFAEILLTSYVNAS